MTNRKQPTSYKKIPDPDSKPVKYLKNRMAGMNKGDAAINAGYADKTHISQIEDTKTYKNAKDLVRHYLPNEKQLADEHKKNIFQDENKAAKNKALDMAYDILGVNETENDFEIGNVQISISKKDD